MYASETWTLTAKDENNLRILERQILRKIFGPVAGPSGRARSKVWVCGRSPAEIVGSNPTGGMDVCFVYCVLSGRGLCDELITCPEESYRLWCVVVCDLENPQE